MTDQRGEALRKQSEVCGGGWLRKGILCLIAVLSCALIWAAWPSQAEASLSISVTLTGRDEDAVQALFLGAMAGFFGVDSDVVVRYQERERNFLENISIFYLAAESGTTPDQIIVLRRQGLGWGEIAHRYGLPENYRGKWMVQTKGKKKAKVFVTYQDRDFELFIFRRFMWEYYGVPEEVIIIWLDRGLAPEEIFLAVNLAFRARVRPEAVLELRWQGKGWEELTQRYKVKYEELGVPVPPREKGKYHVRWKK